MPTPFRVRQALRSATTDWHDRVDRAFSSFDLTDRASYCRFLAAQADAHVAVESALDVAGIGAVLDDWPDRRRMRMLRDDLASLGVPMPLPAPIEPFDGVAAMLGAAYVLEGSRLGGALLKRSVPAELPTGFLGAGDPAAWRRLLEVLDQRIRTGREISAATNAACRVFMLFERAATSPESGTSIV